MLRKVFGWVFIAFGLLVALILLIGRNPVSELPSFWAFLAGAGMFVFPAWIAGGVLLFSRASTRTNWGRLLIGFAASSLVYLLAWKIGTPAGGEMDIDLVTFIFALILVPGLLLAIGLALIFLRRAPRSRSGALRP